MTPTPWRCRLNVATALATLAAFTPSFARADGNWAPVRDDTSADPGALVDPGLAFAADGSGVLARLIEGENPSPIYGTLQADGLAFAGRHAIGGINEDQTDRYFAAYGHGRLVAALLAHPSRSGTVTRRLGAAFGPIGRSLHAVRAVGPEREISVEKVTADARGDIALAADYDIGRPRHPQPAAIYLARRPHGRSFQRLLRVSPVGHLLGFDLATNERGDVLIAWRRGRFIEARIVTAGRRLGKVQRLGPAVEPSTIRVALGPGRGAVVVWESQKLGSGPEPHPVVSPTTVRVAVAGNGGRFGHGSVVERVVDDKAWLGACAARHVVDAAIDRRGQAIAAWTGRVNGHFAVRVATSHGVQTLSDPASDGCLGGLAVGIDGGAALVWSQGNRFSGAQVRAALRAPDADSFGAPEIVGEGAIFPAAVAISPTTHRPFVAWYALDRIRYSSRRP